MDADLAGGDRLGEALTDVDGRFCIRYGAEWFRTRFLRGPAIYLLVYDGPRLLASTRAAAIRDAGAVQEIHVHLPGDGGRRRAGRLVSVGARKVDWDGLDRVTPADVVKIAESMIAAEVSEDVIALLAALDPSLANELVRPKLCSTPLVRFLYDLVRTKGWDRGILLRLEEILLCCAGGSSELASPPFVIQYATSGPCAVRPEDSISNIVLPGTATVVGTTSANGIPDYVERICFWLRHALVRYTSPPFGLRTPLGGASIRVCVNTLDFGFGGGGVISINNNLSDDLLAWVLVHELMHLVQEEYETNGTAGGWHDGREGGAVLAEDAVLDPINRYVAEADAFFGKGTLAAPHVPINHPEHDYKQSLFLKYLSEQHSPRVTATDEPLIGVETYRVLLETFDALGYTTAAVEQAIAALPWYQSFYAFEYVDLARLDESSSETLLGNFWVACYLKDFGVNVPDRRFDFMEDEEAALADVIFSGGQPATLRSVSLEHDTVLASGAAITFASGIDSFGARFYRVALDPAIDTLRVSFSAGGGFVRPLVQVVEVEPGNVVRDILRSDRTVWNRTIASHRRETRLDHLLVVVAGTDTGGLFTLSVQDTAPAPDVMVTRWHHRPGTHFEIDSFDWAWTWVSPDIWVDTDMDGVADDEVFFGQDNKLFIRLRNQGNLAATGIQVDFWYQDASGVLSDAAWQRVQNVAKLDQVLTGLTLAPQSSDRWFVDWAPVPSGGSHQFSVRAVVTVPGDPNTDNKRCVSNFGNVAPTGGLVDLKLVRRSFSDRFEDVRVMVVPRSRGRFSVSQADLARINSIEVKAGSERLDLLRVRRSTVGERKVGGRIEPLDDCRVHCVGRNRLPRLPDPQAHYPTDPRALPPGMADAKLITVVHSVRGKLIGGFTWAIRDTE